ncbi:MAG: SDR family NAD(P)-dependent oxidoreductase [Firmicutes bacterium]|nr:SDR family NAD(P)-dependent oxidoreductase [Bacillota bacterium]
MKQQKNIKYLNNLPTLSGKCAVITGASGVIGKQIAVQFLALGATVVLPCLKEEEGEQLKQELQVQFKADKIIVTELNLTDSKSIDNLVKLCQTLNVSFLVNNAGVIGRLAYQVNFKGTLELTNKMLPMLNKHTDSVIVFQSSMSYNTAKIKWLCKDHNNKKRLAAYAETKLLLNLAVVNMRQNILKNFENVRLEICHPGCVISDIMGKVGNFWKKVAKLFFHTASTAALSATVAAVKTVPNFYLVGPKWFGVWGKPKFRKLNKKLFKAENQNLISNVLLQDF